MTKRYKKAIEKAQDELLETILGSLKENKLPWQKPWKGKLYSPYNPTTNKEYEKTNRFTLLITQFVNGWEDPRWMTYKQAQAKGYWIKKGSVATTLYFAQWVYQDTGKPLKNEDYIGLSDKEKDELRAKLVLKSKPFYVFNAAQITGLPELENEPIVPLTFNNTLAKEFTNNLINKMNLRVEHIGTSAYYTPSEDRVVMPLDSLFEDEQYYYSTLIHELGHSTGHESRLARDLSGKFWSKEYALEELRAEMNSALMALEIGFENSPEHIINHQAYCQSWYTILEDNPKILMDAIRDAQDIRKYMIETGELDLIIEADKNNQLKEFNKVYYEFIEREGLPVQVEGHIYTLIKGSKNGVRFEVEFDTVNFVERHRLMDDYISFTDAIPYNLNMYTEALREKLSYDGLLEKSETDIKFSTENLVHTRQMIAYTNNDLGDVGDKMLQPYLENGSIHIDYELIAKNKFDIVSEIDHETIQYFQKQGIDTAKIEKDLKNKEQSKQKNRVPLDQLKAEVSIIDFAEEVFGLRSVSQSGNLYQLVEHDSCKIYRDNSFVRFSQIQANGKPVGGSVIDFAMHFGGLELSQAVKLVENYYLQNGKTQRIFTAIQKDEILNLELPEKESHSKNVYAYLTKSRGISASVVNRYLKEGLLYQEAKKANCIFVGKLGQDVLYATKRGTRTDSKFMGDVPKSIVEVGVYLNNGSSTLILTESVIDQMSYQSLEKNPLNYNYLSTNGVAKAMNVLKFHLVKRNEKVEKVILAFDNDIKGEEATLVCAEFLSKEYPEIEHYVISPKNKDWNQDLQELKFGKINEKKIEENLTQQVLDEHVMTKN